MIDGKLIHKSLKKMPYSGSYHGMRYYLTVEDNVLKSAGQSGKKRPGISFGSENPGRNEEKKGAAPMWETAPFIVMCFVPMKESMLTGIRRSRYRSSF